MSNIQKYIVVYFLFCALVLGNGAIPTVLAKVLLVLGASVYLIPGSRTWQIMKPYFLWCIAFSFYCVASLRWAYDIIEAKYWITTIVFVYICNIALSAIIINQKKEIQYFFKLFVYFGMIMCLSFIATNGLQYGEALDRSDSAINMNIIGMVAAITSVISFYLYKHENLYKKSRIYIIFAIISLLIVLISASRKALMIPLLAYGVSKLVGKKPSRVVVNIITLSLLGIIAIWAVLNVPILYDMVGYRMEGMINGLFNTGGEIDSSTNSRMQFVEVGMIFFAQSPWIGNGAANFGALYAAYFPGRDAVYAHNNYVELLVDYGVLGLVLYYTFYVFIIVRLIKIIKKTRDQIAILFLSLVVSLMIVEYGFVAYYDLFTNIILTLATCYVLSFKLDVNRINRGKNSII